MPIHLKATPEQIAPYVLLPGDPGRTRFIAENFLENPILYNENRGLLGFTGSYQGMPVSVQTTAMGCPSAAIVTEELATLGAKVVLRVGTCGSVDKNLKMADLVIAQAALPFEGTSPQYVGPGPHAPLASWELIRAAQDIAIENKIPHHVGLIASEDAFYSSEFFRNDYQDKRGVLAVEMEASAVFTVANLRGLKAGCLLTVSNAIGDSELIEPEILQRGVSKMIEVALKTLHRIYRSNLGH